MKLAAVLSGGFLAKSQSSFAQTSYNAPVYGISLAQWSLHKTLFGEGHSARVSGISLDEIKQKLVHTPSYFLRGNLDPLDFPIYSRQKFGIDAVEYVNTFYLGKARDDAYLNELKRRADGEGVQSLLIMCDLEGDLGHPMTEERLLSVNNHKKWVDAAARLGCHSIRVNVNSDGSPEEQAKLVADGLFHLASYAETQKINILVENHGGLSSNPDWLLDTIKSVNHPSLGTLPDFGNFKVNDDELYDPYCGVEKLMPYARAVSAKAFDFDVEGNHKRYDFSKLVKIVVNHGYRGHIGIEYEGNQLAEETGIRLTKALLESIHADLIKHSLFSYHYT